MAKPNCPNVSARQVAKVMGISDVTLQTGIRAGIYPFAKCYKNKTKWTYVFSPMLFKADQGEERYQQLWGNMR